VASDLTRAFCNDIRHRKHLVRLLIQQKVVVAEMAARHMPMEILRPQAKSRRRASEMFATAALLKEPLFAGALRVVCLSMARHLFV
jgi:hypothetical protein